MRFLHGVLVLPLVLGALLLSAIQVSGVQPETDTPRCFPDDFMFGSATAAYQVEGAWNESGRTPSIWDDFCRKHHKVECANVADDFFHRYETDVQLMVASGLQTFRFSVSWSRAMNWDPTTHRMVPNPEGLAFYHALLDTLVANDLVPILTLYHWDLPVELHTELTPQGWLNTDIAGHFVEYAALMFREFGGKVDFWATFNEPLTFTTGGYGSGTAAPGLNDSSTNTYTVAHNVLLSHAAAVKAFRELQASKESPVIPAAARIGIVLNSDFAYPVDPMSALDVAAAERKMQFELGWFLAPLVSGDYPPIMRERVGGRLPRFTPEESTLVKGSYDLFMLNHYSSKLVTDCGVSRGSKVPCKKLNKGWERDLGVDGSNLPVGARPSSRDTNGKRNCGWFSAYPPGYLASIKWLHQHDPSADILLTENGWCGNDQVENMDQLWYFQEYVAQVYTAVVEEKLPVIGYTAWSFLDNYEWGSFKPRFGLYYVNFTADAGAKDSVYEPQPQDLARVPRPAAKWFAHVATTKCLDGWRQEEGVGGDFASVGVNWRSASWWLAVAGCALCVMAFAVVVVIAHRSLRRTRGQRGATESSPLL